MAEKKGILDRLLISICGLGCHFVSSFITVYVCSALMDSFQHCLFFPLLKDGNWCGVTTEIH